MGSKNKKKETRAERVIRFIETHCVVPEGSKVGKPVKLAPFQTKFIYAVYDNEHITDTAILSIARKNAKTGTIAFLLLAHLVGPEAMQNSRIVSGAMSRDQAAEVYNLASKCAAMSSKLCDIVKPVPSAKKLIGIPGNVEYQAISADAHTAHGKSPVLAILDEVGQIVGPRSDFVDAIETAQGAYDHPLIIYISTQAQNDSDFFSIIIDDAKEYKPPKTVCHVYETDKDADLLDEESWKDSNPAIGLFRSFNDMKKQAGKARRMPSFENTFRNLNLNQRVAKVSPLFSKDTWDSCGGAFQIKPEDCDEIYGGIDLSKRNDLTAFILLGVKDGLFYAFCWFWLPGKGLVDRAKSDRVPYDVWVNDGYIETTPGATVRYEWAAKRIIEILKPLTNVKAIAFDRYRMDILKKEFDALGFDYEDEFPFKDFGQGYKDMGPAVEAVEEIVLEALLQHNDNPVLSMCAANAIAVQDPSGARKFDKRKTSGRIDGMVALAMAAGIQARENETEEDIDDFLNEPIKA